MIGCFPHFTHRGRKQTRQALATKFRITTQAIPAVINELAISLLETGRRGDNRVFPLGAIGVARTIQWRQDFTGKAGCFFKNCINDIGRCFLTTRQGNNLLQIGKLLHDKPNIF
jgi:hypothetical protein